MESEAKIYSDTQKRVFERRVVHWCIGLIFIFSCNPVLIFKDAETGQEVERVLNTILGTDSARETFGRLAPIYDPDASPGSQNFETFLVSIKR